ncbi:GntR family transcriptional regulator [Micromonospora sp. NPDC002575]|uniref:GntR family transcriptional regulator n=1 Tax=Micromonospora sp. NPDC002575 TaxID=3364222 RepID=UPI00369F4697
MPTPHYGQPRYRAIADELRRRIENGVIPPGALLPAESTLTAEFRAARGTIRKAIATLRDEGFAATEQGRGTYALSHLDSAKSGDAVEKKTSLRTVPASAEIARVLGIETGSLLVEKQTILRRHGIAYSLTREYRIPPG